MSINMAVNPEKKSSYTGVIIAGFAGNIMEWFDYSLYAFFATAISVNFFPTKDPFVSLLLSFLVFGLGFGARPLGGFVFGYLGDKIGRKNTLSFTVILMGSSTFLMGIIPTYAKIGIAAPIILTFARMLQGIAAGGEWGSCVSFLGEYAKSNNRAFIVSFSQVGAAGGLLLGALIGLLLSSVMPKEDLLSWGWRIAFILGIAIAYFGYYMRRNVEETPAFKKNLEEKTLSKSPIRDVFKSYKKEMFIVLMYVCGGGVTYWLILGFMPTYIAKFLKLPIATGFSLTAITQITIMLSVPIVGYLADKFGRKQLMVLGSGGIAFLSYPLFRILANANSYWEMVFVVVALALIFSLFLASGTVAMTELFPTKVRVTGYSIPYQLGAALFSGTAMFVVTWLIGRTGNVMAVPIYMSVLMGITLLVIIFLYKETKDKPYND